MSSDTAPTRAISASGVPSTADALDAVESKLEEFRRQPTAAAYHDLRAQLRAAGRGELLAELCATWAPHEADPIHGADAWSEAGEAMQVLGEHDTAIAYLRTALDLDPANERAAERLIELYEADDPAAAVEIVEAEVAELAKREGARASRGSGRPGADTTARRAMQHRRAAELWNDELGRVDRALYHWQQAWRLEPHRTEALEAARVLYASLGDDAMVGKLYQAELDVLAARPEPNEPATAQRRAAVHHQLGRLALRAKDLEAAAKHLEEASRLDPTANDIAETLAEVYATPGFRDGGTAGRAGQLFVELGRRQLATADGANAADATAGGLNYLRRAVGVDPYSKHSSSALQHALATAGKWGELDRILRQRSELERDPADRANVLRQRADLYREQLADRESLIEVLTQLIGYEPPGGEAAEELRELLRADQDWQSLSRLIEAEINALAADPETPGDTLVAEILELATIAREHMGDRDRAAELLHQALGVSPTHEEALARYVDHFRERRDWRGLIDLSEFALDNARAAHAPIDELVRRLEEIAQLAELRLGDIPRAIDAWKRIAELEPDSSKVTEALRRLHARAKMWDQLVASLEHDVASAPDPGVRTTALRKMAQTYRERQIEPRRAIELYEEIAAANTEATPELDATLKALSELYEKEGDDAGLATTLRRMLDLEAARQTKSQGKAIGDRLEWPVAKRSERLTMLRRLAVLCETRLADVDGVVFACSAVLELLPADRDAMERMERVLDKAGDPRLERSLEYHAAASTNPAERAKLMRRLAKLASDRGDPIAALDRWEQTLRASPADPEALAALAEIYERTERWVELAQILERLDGGRPLPALGTPEAAVRALELERYATVLDVRLKDPTRAIKAWHRVLELSPRNRAALDALTRLYRAASKWRELADVLGRQVPLYTLSDGDSAKAAGFALERAEILEERLGAPAEAIKVLELLLRDINPNHLEAHTALRRLHEARGDFDAAVRVAEREMYLAPEAQRKIARGLEIGLMCRDRLGNPTRALQAFERVLALDPEQDEALSAAADLLAKLGRWKDHVRILERMFVLTSTAPEPPAGSDGPTRTESRRALIQRIAHATAEKLSEPKAAFRWLRRAHDDAPDDNTLSDLRRFAESFGLQRELAEVLGDERRRVAHVSDTASFVALSRELAQLNERRLGDKPRAVAVLAEALAVVPRDPSLLGELERLAAEIDERTIWKALVDAYELALAAAVPPQRVELYLRRARILDERVVDPKAAVADVLAAFSWAPDRDDLRDLLLPLAAKARAWTDVIAVDTALIDRAQANPRRVELLRRKASVIEDQLKDAPRAFRIHLVALMLEPDDADTASHLWRLARVIGRYREADRMPRPEPAGAQIQDPAAIAEAGAAAGRAGAVAPPALPGLRIPKRATTEPIGDDELGDSLGDSLDSAEANLAVGDSTQPIDVHELELASDATAGKLARARTPRPDATLELSPRDLIIPPRTPAAGKLPPLPPRPPQIRPASRSTPPPMAVPRKSQAIVRRAPLPVLLARAFDTPWEELALTYEALPAPDPATTLRWLYRAAEIWESGALDIAKAFDTLARAFALARRAPAGLGKPGLVGGDTEVRARLGRIAQEHRAYDALAELYEGMAEQADTAASAVDLLMEVANIRAEQKRPRDAEAQLRRILGMLPSDATARARIEALYRAEGRWVELAASLEERTDPRLGTAAPEAERPQLLRELAGIYTDKLSRPHDAIDAFERLRLLAPTDLDILARLGELYGAVGRWSKVIETLARVGEIAEGSPQARDALRSIAQIYERELELPDRATETYNQLVATWPDDEGAWAALDALYAGTAKWTELADVLRRRAALAREPAERAHLLARRAQVLLEWLDAPEDAAAALRHARTIAPDDVALADHLIGALTKTGRDREAAAILEARITAITDLPAGTAPRGELAALYIRLAQIKLDRLGDREGARTAVDHALALVPEHPGALAVLASVASPDDDPRAFADAKLREADSATDDDARIAALMAAGDVLGARVGEPAAAQAAYERVLALRPYHSEATWALAGLVEQGGDPDAAARVLETRLDAATLVPAERARLLTQLAALTRAAGVDQAAERRLLEALAIVPDHLPAIIALADFYADAERWTDLELFLREILGEVEGGERADGTPGGSLHLAPPALIADLHRRMATAHEKLGRDEDAYQTLVAADRLHRGHLLIKLALGENRYKARRWREAALHLSPLAQHEDAPRYPSEVAQGLYHAALAEIRSLRPEKAAPLYVRTLELKPNYAPALQALAEIAMEQGDHRRAADLLTRQATATEDAAERMRLFEALGDMALMMLHDEPRALTCYSAAVAAAQPMEARHLALLDKLLTRQAAAGDHAGAGRTAELMAAFGATPAERAAGHLRAARDFLAADDPVRARAAAERAVEHDPHDIDAADLASELAAAAGDVDAAATTLTRMLAGRADREIERRAALSARLGDARAQRGDIRQATAAYERAIVIAPSSQGATAAHRALATILRDGDAPRDVVAGHLQAVAAATGALADLTAWADALRRSNDPRHGDTARAALDVAIGAGHVADLNEQGFLQHHRPHALRADESYRGAIDAADRALLVDAPAGAALLAPIAATLAEAAALLWSDLDEALARAGADGARRVPATSHAPATAMFPRLTTALGAGAVMLYQRDSGPDVSVVCGPAPIIVLGPRLADEAAPLGDSRALLARAVELTRPEHVVFVGLPPADAVRLLAVVARQFGPPALREAAEALVVDADIQRAYDEMVRSALSVRLRTRFEQLLANLPPSALDVPGYVAASQRTADRAALALAGDPAIIVGAAAARGESPAHLLRAVAAPGWMELRTKLGVGIR